MGKRRVVVTGLGVVSPLGLNVEQTWRAILEGRSGVDKITAFDASAFSVQICAAVKNFNPELFLSTKDIRKNDTFVQYGIAAAVEAMSDSGLQVTPENAHRMGVAVGSGIGGLPMIEANHQAWLEGGPRKIAPSFIPGAIINTTAGQLSIRYGLTGPNISLVTACTTGTHNIGYAARIIAYGDADVMLVGGSEMATSPLGIGGFAAMRALSTRNDDPARASRPWDKDRDGFVLGEGAGILVIEEYEHAKRRGAKIYAELSGFGASADAHHMTLPHASCIGGMASMLNALRDAELNIDDVDYINAHATSTPAGDEVEAIGIQNAFGHHAKLLLVSSTKSMTGHLLGAAGAVEAVFSVLAIRDQVAPPTINLDNPADGCHLDFVPHQAKPAKIRVALSNSFGFGGTNGSLVFKAMSK